MISKNDIAKIARHVFRKGEGYPDRHLIHPLREWGIGLSVSALLFIVGVGYGGYSFIAQSEKIDEEIYLDESVTLYKQKQAMDILEEYENRTQEFERLRSDRSNVVIVPTAAEEVVSEESEDEELLVEEAVTE